MAIVVADVFFLHQRGRFVGIYFWCYFIGLMLGPIIAGNVAAHVSWRWFFWACMISQVLNFFSLLFFFPETLWNRSTQSPKVQSGTTTPLQDGKPQLTTHSDSSSAEEAIADESIVDHQLGRGRPSRSQFNLTQGINRKALSTIWHHIVTPIELFSFPIVFWVCMAMGAAANALLCVNITQSQALAAPPYNFGPQNVGFANFALAAGAVIGLLTAGPMSDWIAMRATRRNGGIREPEMRLPALIPFILIAALGMTVVGVGYQNHWPWEAVIILGFTCVGMITVAIPTITITYAIDCYKPVAGQIMVIATVVKNTFGFGETYYVNKWAITAPSGFVAPLMLLGAMTVGFTTLGMLVSLKWGKTMRRWTRDAKVHGF
jgi:Major Facilitator Superfamily